MLADLRHREYSGSEVRSDPERFSEPGHVVAVALGGFVALVEVDLLFGGQAGNGAVLNRAGEASPGVWTQGFMLRV
ncbi:hypothetical protein GCM10010446_65670 [Streptomyces enissocaesilis]|uniref:Uncharacterized protein n=1 Tax=Streptomyces enissocaesilis TaxID=332589 RepID=A0ABP6K7V9_9ACTN